MHLIVPKSTRDQILKKMTVDLAVGVSARPHTASHGPAKMKAEVGFIWIYHPTISIYGHQIKGDNEWNEILNHRLGRPGKQLCMSFPLRHKASKVSFVFFFNIDNNDCTETSRSQVATTFVEMFFVKSTKNQLKRKVKQNNPRPKAFRSNSSASRLHKFTGQDPADVQVLRVGFERLVVSQDLCSAGGGHGSHQQAVAKSMLGLGHNKAAAKICQWREASQGEREKNPCNRRTQTHTTSSIHWKHVCCKKLAKLTSRNHVQSVCVGFLLSSETGALVLRPFCCLSWLHVLLCVPGHSKTNWWGCWFFSRSTKKLRFP